jgi:hypothetical protein
MLIRPREARVSSRLQAQREQALAQAVEDVAEPAEVWQRLAIGNQYEWRRQKASQGRMKDLLGVTSSTTRE